MYTCDSRTRGARLDINDSEGEKGAAGRYSSFLNIIGELTSLTSLYHPPALS